MIKALLFDFDGLILDTEVPEYEAWRRIYDDYGHHLHMATWADCIGRGTDQEPGFDPHRELERLHGQAIHPDVISAKRQPREEQVREIQSPLPGVTHVILEAKDLGLKLGVASSSSREWVVGNLTRLGLVQYFDSVKTSDDVTHTKPNPELYLTLLKSLGVEGREAIALEDSHHGTSAAKAAGIFCISVPTAITAHLPYEHTDLRLSSLTELHLTDLIQTLQEGSLH